LMTWDLYNDWVQVGLVFFDDGPSAMSLEEARRILRAIPVEHRYFLQVLFKVLHEIADPKHSELNMMGPSNIAIVFAPILLVRKGASPFDTSDFKASNLVISTLITDYHAVFDDIEQERLAKAE